ncbi:MAG TPA: ArsA family ATPase [Solirubrobacteraceae bacterium]|nr:ArsA family ATPase [Solirubrobacteraceae bacterium]
MSLLDRRLLVVTGKGGTGKSTVAAALGMVAAREGRRTIVAEVAQRTDVPGALGAAAGKPFAETRLRDGLWHISVDPADALREYLRDQLPSATLARVLGASRSFALLASATPGLAELLSMGKVWELAQDERRTPGAQSYDLVILDAPATGHGLATLTAPRAFARAAATGPVARQGRLIHDWLTDRRHTGVLAVARAEALPVAETIALADDLRAQLGLELDAVAVNGLSPQRFGRGEEALLQAALEARSPGPRRSAGDPVTFALERALADLAVTRGERRQVERLRRAVSLPPLRLPFAVGEESGETDLEVLALALERGLARAVTRT